MKIRKAVLCVVLLSIAGLCTCRAVRAQAEQEFGREVVLEALSDFACSDVYEIATQHALLRLNYIRSDTEPPKPMSGLTRSAYLVRQTEGGTRQLLVGLRCYATQANRLYLWGTSADGQPNPDLDVLQGVVAEAVQARQQSPRSLALRDLLYETYQLSNIDYDSCLKILKGLGYSTEPPGATVDISKLPTVFHMPVLASETVVGRSARKEHDANLPADTISAPENRLMIIYHPSQSEEFGNLRDLLDKTVDVPAQQVLIEGMVIELTEDDFKSLGVEWEWFNGRWQKATFLADGEQVPFVISYDPQFTPPADLANRVRATLTAIIEEGRGEVLSSPSILVLDNRNARIQVVRDVPIFESLITERTTDVKVRFERVGIVLNIKPRISGDKSVVAMQILVEVSEAPEEDFIIVEDQAVAPLINRRIVETVARVNDNTPFIIGGLIRDENARTMDRIPIISNIPIIGRLFRRQSDRRAKREVIIVLTPRVIATGGTNRPVLPKDSERFDFLNNRLFRNSYRLKADDVFDLGFLEGNMDVQRTMSRARQFAYRNPSYTERQPFKDILADTIPGEDAVVVRMIYEVAKDKLQLHERIDTENIIVFEQDDAEPAGFHVAFLARGGGGVLEENSPDGTVAGYFARPYPKEVLFLRYRLDPEGGLKAALQSPTAKLEWLRVADRDAVEQHLLEINQVGSDLRYEEFALVLDTESDLERLKTAIAMREIAKVNNIEELLLLRNFRVGRKIVIPELDGPDERIYLADRTVAEFFFKSDYYYYALRDALERAYDIISEAIASEEPM